MTDGQNFFRSVSIASGKNFFRSTAQSFVNSDKQNLESVSENQLQHKWVING
jgi:hypothetical protein